jgi:sn-glycerol 3-phosphate transport system substrate-binding protein
MPARADRNGRRRWLTALVVLAVLAAACGGDGGVDGDAGGDGGGGEEAQLPDCPVGAHEQATEPVDVVVWHSFQAKVLETLQALTDEYNSSQDQVEVHLESQGLDYETVLRKYTEAIPSGDLPAVLLTDDPTTQYLTDTGTLLPAQACFEAADISLDQFAPTAVSYYTIDGALQPGVVNLAGTLLYYNREHFTQAGLDPDQPPQTLEEVREVAQAIKDAGVVDTPLVMSLQPWLIEFWLTGAGAPVVDHENGRDGLATAGALESDQSLEVYQWIADMHADGLLRAVPDAPGTLDHYFAIGLGEASMLPDTSTAATSVASFLRGDLTLEGSEDIDASGLDIDAAPFPGLTEPGLGQIGGTAWFLTAEQPDEVIAGAFDYLMFMNSVEAQVRWNLEGSFTPWVTAALDDPALQEAWQADRLGSWLATAAEQVSNIDPAFPGPLIGPYTEVRNAIRDSLDRMILEGQAPGETIAEADQQITDAVKEYEEENF